jgi:hypothetical protein
MKPLNMDQQFAFNRHKVVKNLLPAEAARRLGAEFKKYVEEEDCLPDTQVTEKSRAFGGFFPFWQILVDANPIVGANIGTPVLPTYTYSRMYLKGAELTRHRDLPQCEIGMSIHLDGDKKWPLWIQTSMGERAIYLEPGDALIYQGSEVDHWREPYHGNWYVNAFMFYVFTEGPNRDLFFNTERVIKGGDERIPGNNDPG